MSGSRVFMRWALPIAVIWAGVLLSAWVYSRLPDGTQVQPVRAAVTLLIGPVLSLFGFMVFRFLEGRIHHGSQSGAFEDLVVVWVMTFLFGVHALILAVSIGLVESIHRALPFLTGVLLVGLGPVVARLPFGSSMGIRTRRTLSATHAWTRTHRLMGVLFPLAGLLGFSSWWLQGWQALAASVIPALLVLAISIGYGSIVRLEDAPEPARPKDNASP